MRCKLINIITSTRNPVIKEYKKLLQGPGEGGTGGIPIEGMRLIEGAVKSGVELDRLFYAPEIITTRLMDELKALIPPDVQWIAVSREVFHSLAQTKNPRGVTAVARSYPEPPLNELINKPNFLGIMVDRLQDPGNMGTIIRTAAAAGVTAVFCTPGTVNRGNSKVIRSTAGAFFAVPVINVADPVGFLQRLIRKKIWVIAADAGALTEYYALNYRKTVVFIIGNENNGISPELMSLSADKIKISMNSPLNSINASTAAGIILFEAVRQRLT